MKRIALIGALLTLGGHLLLNPHYGFFRDELYFIVCGMRPDWGYVDQPPLVPLLSAASQLFGTSLFLLRAVPAVFAAAGVYAACLLAIELGAGEFGVAFTAMLTALVPVLDAFGTKVSTDMPGLFLWTLAAWFVARMVNGASKSAWIGAGVALGIAAEAKYTVFFFAAALIAGIALSPVRRILLTPWFAAGGAAGAAIAAPSVVWQYAHGWPIVQMLHGQQQSEVPMYGPAAYVVQQLLLTNPIYTPIWVGALVWAFREPRARWIGWTYVLLIAAMILWHGRNYYPGDVYPMLAAAGAIAVERTAALTRLRPAIVAGVAVISLLTVPFIFPIVAEARLAATIAAAKRFVHIDVKSVHGEEAPLTQNFADMHGWPQLAAAVAAVYNALPPTQRAHAAILASNFGEAGAIDVYGKAYGLPPAISGHNSYWLWGPRNYDGSVLVEVNGTCGNEFRSRRVAVARFYNAWAMPAENGIPISVCYGLEEPVAAYWAHQRKFI